MPDTHPPRETPAAAFAARYAGATPAPQLPANQVIEVMLAHRTVRRYTDQPIPEGVLETMVAAASSAPTSSNLQTWSVVAVQDKDRIAKLAELSMNQQFINTAPLFLAWCADLSRLERLGERVGHEMEALPYLEMYQTAAIDAALAAQNALVAAESLGLGTCYIGGLRTYPVQVAEVLGLPPQVVAVFGCCVGWPDPAAVTEIKPRLPQQVVLHRETYSAGADAAHVPGYDQAMLEFSRRNGMGEADWSRRALSRAGKVGGMSGRHKMTEDLKQRGFGLK